jgi:UDP-N-acetylmuramoyl-L-alanyl-D-glutamate--2,6-diaminopimelate ligase
MNEAGVKTAAINSAAPASGQSETASGGRRLTDLLDGLACRCYGKSDLVTISAITADSRQVAPGTLFVAVAGLQADGHRFVADALARGCAAVVGESGRLPARAGGAVYIEVEDSREALGRIAAALYGHPGRDLQLIGITGTNGKTTCSYLLEAVIRAGGGNPGVIGTVNYRFDGKVLPAPFTTPEPVTLHRILHQMRAAGVTHVIMEVSSHSLVQKRVAGLEFDVALFTNLSRDHLDFHPDMTAYFESKKKLFTEHLKTTGRVVVMATAADSKPAAEGWGARLTGELRQLFAGQPAGAEERQILTCGFDPGCDITASSYHCDFVGLQAKVRTPAGEWITDSPLVGLFNLENLLVTVGAAIALGLPADVIQRGLAGRRGAPGRLERVPARPGIEVLVDYAHTPAALENVIDTLRQLGPRRLIVLFGCGGDRDRGKRPLMGEIAARLADVVLVTADNPRSEDPAAIFIDIEQGIRATGGRPAKLPRLRAEVLLRGGRRGYDIVPSRREAIGLAIRHSRPGDMILISGKGHEDYQLTRTGRIFFDDRLEVQRQAAVIAW